MYLLFIYIYLLLGILQNDFFSRFEDNFENKLNGPEESLNITASDHIIQNLSSTNTGNSHMYTYKYTYIFSTHEHA